MEQDTEKKKREDKVEKDSEGDAERWGKIERQ